MKYPSICFDRFKMPEFSIATTDICLTEDMSRYRFYSKGKKYFSYEEAMLLVDFLNSGCPTGGYDYDLPTDEDFKQIIAKYGYKDGICHSYNLATALGLGFYGSIGILTALEEYNKSPLDFTHRQAIAFGVTGHYWCKGTGEYEGQASIFCMNSCGEPTFIRNVLDNGKHIGCSVRLIGKPW